MANYYISSFFWSTLSKVLTAIIGFISIPLLLGYYGKAEYGILSIATACNGYMHLLDLGMNTGSVRFFSQWKTQGYIDKIYRVARTNITFYCFVSFINIIGLLALAVWGEGVFSVSHEQFCLLQKCLFVIAMFNVFSWGTTTFNQLLIADNQMPFTMQIQCIITLLKALVIGLVFLLNLTLVSYFFCITAIVALAIIPYAYKCKKDRLIDSFKLSWYWDEFKIVLMFSLSIFSLSIFQITASQSRPIVLSVFAENGAELVAEYRILEVIPQLIIMIGGAFSGIFLPKTTDLVVKNDKKLISLFAKKWTTLTSVIVASFCFPCILCSKEIIYMYVGENYLHLSSWLMIWCFIVYLQMHATPCYSLIMSKGRNMSGLVALTAVSCILSIILNSALCKTFFVGSTVIGYLFYVSVLMTTYYFVFYKKYLSLSRSQIILSFLKPTIVAIFISALVLLLFNAFYSITFESSMNRFYYIGICVFKVFTWIILFYLILYRLKIIDKSMFQKDKHKKSVKAD